MKLKEIDLTKVAPIIHKAMELAVGDELSNTKITNPNTYESDGSISIELPTWYCFTVYSTGKMWLHDLNENIGLVIENLQEVVQMINDTQWIDPRDKLPESTEQVIVKCHDGSICTGSYVYDRKFVSVRFNDLWVEVSHGNIYGWMRKDNVVMQHDR